MKVGVLINFSGHPLSNEALFDLSSIYETVVQAQPINFDFFSSPENQLEQIVESLEIKIDGTKPVSIIPPGQSVLSVLLTAYLHGLLGHFPSICYLQLSDSGIYMPTAEFSINSNRIRNAGRKFRSNIFPTSYLDKASLRGHVLMNENLCVSNSMKPNQKGTKNYRYQINSSQDS